MRARNGKKILSALLAAAILMSMAACGKKDGDEAEAGPDSEANETAPELIGEFPFGEIAVPGLTSASSRAAVTVETVYSYTGLSSSGGDVRSYVSLMTGDTNGFEVVDKDYVISDQPEYDDAGKVLLARAAEAGEDGSAGERLMLIDISWAEDSCVIVTREAEGVISQPPEPITMREAQQKLESMTPAELGLEGESMDEYEVFTFDGAVVVDGRACVRMNVYNFEQSNEFMGCYLMSLDGRHLYRMDTATQEITELD